MEHISSFASHEVDGNSNIQSEHGDQGTNFDVSTIKQRWAEIQLEMKDRLCLEDKHEWNLGSLRLIGGVDISYIKGNMDDACVSFVVLEYPSLQVVYEDSHMVHLEQPYYPGFLAFREVIMVDGNGILHPRGFGLASHLGVEIDIPTANSNCQIGIGKTLFMVDGLDAKGVGQEARQTLTQRGESLNLVGSTGAIWGAALRTTETSVNPVFVSIGHRVSLQTALSLVTECSNFRIPEPIRQADKRSREYLKRFKMN
eukprot:gene1968-5052_t